MLVEERAHLHRCRARLYGSRLGDSHRRVRHPDGGLPQRLVSVPHVPAGQTVWVREHGDEIVIVHVGPGGQVEVARDGRTTPGSPRVEDPCRRSPSTVWAKRDSIATENARHQRRGPRSRSAVSREAVKGANASPSREATRRPRVPHLPAARCTTGARPGRRRHAAQSRHSSIGVPGGCCCTSAGAAAPEQRPVREALGGAEPSFGPGRGGLMTSVWWRSVARDTPKCPLAVGAKSAMAAAMRAQLVATRVISAVAHRRDWPGSSATISNPARASRSTVLQARVRTVPTAIT